MSRIGRKPIVVPDKVTATIQNGSIAIKGPKGELSFPFPEGISVKLEDGMLSVARSNDEKAQRALHGLTRALIANMVIGVTDGYMKELEIVGVGFRAQVQGKILNLQLGYSHPVNITIPDGIVIETPKPTHIVIKGIDKQLVGDVAARIRGVCKPEPYKGKGIRYMGEQIRRKAGKAVA